MRAWSLAVEPPNLSRFPLTSLFAPKLGVSPHFNFGSTHRSLEMVLWLGTAQSKQLTLLVVVSLLLSVTATATSLTTLDDVHEHNELSAEDNMATVVRETIYVKTWSPTPSTTEHNSVLSPAATLSVISSAVTSVIPVAAQPAHILTTLKKLLGQ